MRGHVGCGGSQLGIKMEAVENVQDVELFYRLGNSKPRGQGGDTVAAGGPLMKPTVSKPYGGKGRWSGAGSVGEERRLGLLGSSGGVYCMAAHQLVVDFLDGRRRC
jgi:hypothetical protein